jgi:hypothetical protein
MHWPKSVPDDLRRKLEAVLGYRNRPAPQDVWGAMLEWLQEIGVEMPNATLACMDHEAGSATLQPDGLLVDSAP